MTEEPEAKSKREISSIGFPYLDLDDAVEVARAMLDRGAVPMDRDQLAAALGNVPTSGAFAIKLSTARMFGLLESVQGKNQLTPLGFEILDASRSRAAKAEAFLAVPLFKKAFEEFKGRQLPPRPAGLEQAFVSFGVSAKQKDRARQVFDRSARSAGFFPNAAEDRLVQPVIAPGALVPVTAVSSGAETRSEPSDWGEIVRFEPPERSLHPFIEGLLETLPAAKSDWPSADRAKWLQAAAQIFNLLYTGGDGEISVSVKKAM